MENLTRFVLRHRWAVLGAWIVLLAAAGAAVVPVSPTCSRTASCSRGPTRQGRGRAPNHFGQIPDGAFTVVARGAALGDLREAAERAADEIPGARVAAVQPVDQELSTALIVSELERADAKAYTDDIRAALKSDLDAEQAG